MIDYRSLSDDELQDHLTAAYAEERRRGIIRDAEADAERINQNWSTATGRADGDEWVQPTGAHNAYPANATVTHGGKTWVSLTPANVWEPGVSGWREVVEDGGVPEWVQPTGGHDAYKTGDQVSFEGQVFESIIDGNVWSPSAHPAGWKLVTT